MAIAETVTALGALMRGMGQAGGLLSNLFGDQPEVPSPYGYTQWVEHQPEMTAMIQGLMPMPYLSGVSYPTHGGPFLEKETHMFGDMSGVYPVTQELYRSALGRDYGYSPQDLAAQQQQMLASQGLNLSGAYTPATFAQSSYLDPQAVAQSLGGMEGLAYRDQQSYLRNAAQLASYNAQRARALGGMLGSVS
jgi:hypothetical protein